MTPCPLLYDWRHCCATDCYGAAAPGVSTASSTGAEELEPIINDVMVTIVRLLGVKYIEGQAQVA